MRQIDTTKIVGNVEDAINNEIYIETNMWFNIYQLVEIEINEINSDIRRSISDGILNRIEQ